MSQGISTTPVVHLTIRRGPRPGQTFSAPGPSVVIGRVPGNDIILDDPQVSRHHASLTLEGGQWVLRDLGSTNGTTVNGQPVHPGHTPASQRLTMRSEERRGGKEC